MDIMKQTAIEAIRRLPDGCSVEEIMYQIYFVSQVLEGLKDAQQGRVITGEELWKKMIGV